MAFEARHWFLVGWVGVAAIVASAFVPWVEVTSPDGDSRGYLLEGDALALVPFAAVLIVCIGWLLHRLRFGLIAAVTGTALVVLAEIMTPVLSASQSDETIGARQGMHLALIGYVVLTLAAAAVRKSSPRRPPRAASQLRPTP